MFTLRTPYSQTFFAMKDLWRALCALFILLLLSTTATYSQETAWCEDFEDSSGWQSRWDVSQGYQTLVNSPAHSGTGALEFHGSCHSSIYRKNFSAGLGEYSAWVNQQHSIAHFEMQVQVNPVDNYPLDGEAYRLLLSAQNSSGGLFRLERSRGGVHTVLVTGESTFLLGEWIKVFINRKPGGVIECGYDRNGEIHVISAVDPDPIEAPGGFYLWACSDVPPYTYFDDACYQPLPDSCMFGNALRFDGVDDYVYVSHNPSQNPANLTIEAYIRMDGIPTSVPSSAQAIVSKWRGVSSALGSYMLQIASTADSARVRLNIEPSQNLYSRQRLLPHTWYHLAATWDGTTAKIFINGMLDTATNMTGGFYSDREITIGRNSHSLWDGSVAPYSFNGIIDEVRISSIARTPSEFCLTGECTSDANTVALWHFDEGSGSTTADSSSNGNHGTINGAIWELCANPGAPSDTLIIGQPDCLVSVTHNNLFIPIYLNNHDTVKAVDVPLQYDWSFDPDSISYVGTRVHDFDLKIRSIDAVNKKIRIALIADNSGGGRVLLPVDAASANIPVAKIMFHRPYACAQEMIAPPDSCTLVLPGDNVQSLKVVDNHDVGYVPALERDSTKILRYKPGDCNGDDNVDISDVVCLISYIFSGGTPVCLAASDANCDAMVDISDVVYLIAYIFSGGSMPGSNLLCDYQAPLAKAIPSTAELTTFAGTSGEVATMRLGISTTVGTKGLQLEFVTGNNVQITGVKSNIEGMDVFSGTVDGLFKVGLLDMTGKAVIPAGQHDVVTITYASTSSHASTGSAASTSSARTGDGEIKLVNAIVVGEDASKMNVTITNKGVTEQNDGVVSLPKIFGLSQNIPNPFNPTTEIGYALPKASPVRLEVLNVLGQVVRTLVDEFQTAGNHSTIWDGRDNNYQEVSSGVYFYRIAAGEYAETRKMVLMK
jgi:hypothetical protein